MRQEPRQAMLAELERPLEEGENTWLGLWKGKWGGGLGWIEFFFVLVMEWVVCDGSLSSTRETKKIHPPVGRGFFESTNQEETWGRRFCFLTKLARYTYLTHLRFFLQTLNHKQRKAKTPAKESSPREPALRLRAVDLWEPLLLSMEDLLGIPRNTQVSRPCTSSGACWDKKRGWVFLWIVLLVWEVFVLSAFWGADLTFFLGPLGKSAISHDNMVFVFFSPCSCVDQWPFVF